VNEHRGAHTEDRRRAPSTAHERAFGSGAVPVEGRPLRAHRNAFDPVQIRVGPEECRDLTRAAKKEWLLANGVGGFACSTVVGLNTRREHGLLVAPVGGGVGRAMILSKMKETVHVPGASRSIDTSFYPGVVHPRGYELCTSFSRYPLPTFSFAGLRWRLERRVALVHDENTVVVSYQLLSRGPAPGGDSDAPPLDVPPLLDHVRLRVRPQFGFRPLHALGKQNDDIQRNVSVRDLGAHGSVMRCTPYPDWDPVYLTCAGARFTEAQDWYKNVEYPKDRYRGLEFTEDLFGYGYFEAELRVDETLTVKCTLRAPESRASPWSERHEVERLSKVMVSAPDDTPFARRLVLAADQFILHREREVPAVITGYPFVSDRARDTLIAMPGLLLIAGRYREAKAILRAYARALDRGLLPDRMDDGGRPENMSVDATLWFYIAIFKYLQYTADFDFIRTELRLPMLETVRYFEEGTRGGIHVDTDGFLRCGQPGSALTWMDARVDGQPVTPRDGKPVEVNALWYNALRVLERVAERFSIPNDVARFAERAHQVESRFRSVFWNDAKGCLNDVVHREGVDDSVRPNQLLAITLPFPLLDSESADSVVRVVGERLLTPRGLRTLDPEHPAYRGAYEGSDSDREYAAHQGTAYTWLLGTYLTALTKVRGGSGRAEAARLLEPLERHALLDGLGQLSELFWGDAPHWPRGNIAHAAAVGEVLRAYHEDVLGRAPGMGLAR
jgi:glycogen debranching enzyme